MAETVGADLGAYRRRTWCVAARNRRHHWRTARVQAGEKREGLRRSVKCGGREARSERALQKGAATSKRRGDCRKGVEPWRQRPAVHP